MAEPLHDLMPSPGWLASERTPDTDQLYVSVEELSAKYCYAVDEGEIRFAQALINAHTNRPSLWPEIYEERIDLADDRNTCILAARPVLKILAASGRYGGGRRDQRTMMHVNFDYLAALAVLGSAPRWTAIDVDLIELYPPTGEIWLPMSFYPIRFAQAQVRYQTGLPQIPDRVKAAVADIINTVRNKGVSDRNYHSVGKVQQTYSGVGFISETSRMFLSPFVVTSLM